ncbi:hypothetical protein [Cognatiyoonia sp. IB215182]|uniref:hypothetical protein n=1 Tax=Cognatiyoonia sp. IB215182 TaxID=3097353 RepID=UPI002A0B0B6B|nr:hypothetical protein [Cognatiyoonia sp. IB215182]MDX8352183.1 hypothetical protein [Cognatiyoonia sp. IB215182]
MQLTELFAALSSDPEQLNRSILRIFHFLGLTLGLGAATLLDLMIIRFFLGRVTTEQTFEMFTFLADLVSAGLKLLWVTGLGFLIFYWFYEPVKLGNEKVWAKMVIVGILTINGYFIHRSVIPFIHGQIGHRMLDGVSLPRKIVFVTMGIVSFVSWYGPLIIANLSPLNFQVPMLQILALYGIVLFAALTIAHAILFGSQLAELTRHLFLRRSRYL